MTKTKIKLLSSVLLALGVSTCCYAHAIIDPGCFVIGVREPQTNIYNGPTSCSDITLSTLTVRGPLELNGTTIQGVTEVSGPIKADGAYLENIVVKSQLNVQSITLQAQSKVTGDIKFEGKAGIVYVEKGSGVNGKIINGKLIEQ